MKTIVAAALVASASLAQAQVTFGVSGGNVTVTILSNISFVAAGKEGSYLRFVFDDAYSVAPGVSFPEPQSNTIGVSVNGTPFGLGAVSLWGPLHFTLGEIDGDDFTISFYGTVGFGVGDTVTLTPGMAVTNVPASLLPDRIPTMAVMTGSGGNAISAPVMLTPVPEPTTYSLSLFGLGLIGAAMVRRRRA